MAREFFLGHQLYRSHRTGEVVDQAFTRFPFPPQWHFDVLRGLEHFAAVGAPADERLADAVDVVARRPAGRRPVAGAPWLRRSVLVRDGGAWPEPLGHAALPARTALVGRAVPVTSRGAPVATASHDFREDAGVVADDAADAVLQHGLKGVPGR